MDTKKLHESERRSWLWRIARRQHGVVARRQLVKAGFQDQAIKHRLARGQLHRTWMTGVYAVGRPELDRLGKWMAAILACGPCASLSHRHAAALWGILGSARGAITVSIPAARYIHRRGVDVHRRRGFGPEHRTVYRGIPVTKPAVTLVDLATVLDPDRLEAAVNAADRLGLIDPDSLRRELDRLPRWPGVGQLRRTLDRSTLRLTDSELERRFLRLLRRHRLPLPATGQIVNGFKVDFFWPELGLVVETDGWRYHRTPAQQRLDRRRDQAHTAAGLTSLRFTHGQVSYEGDSVVRALTAVIVRLQAATGSATRSRTA